MKLWTFLLLVLLSSAGWCRNPEAVVAEIFRYEQRAQNALKTIRACETCFTPGFLGVLERALGRDPRKGGPYVDWNILGNSQTGTGHFEVGQPSFSGSNAVVPVRVWTGLRSEKTVGDAGARASWPNISTVRAHLTDVGAGWQIYDLEWLGEKRGNDVRPAIWVRKAVTPIAEGRWP